MWCFSIMWYFNFSLLGGIVSMVRPTTDCVSMCNIRWSWENRYFDYIYRHQNLPIIEFTKTSTFFNIFYATKMSHLTFSIKASKEFVSSLMWQSTFLFTNTFCCFMLVYTMKGNVNKEKSLYHTFIDCSSIVLVSMLKDGS